MSEQSERPKPFREGLEQSIVLPQAEIDALEWTWGLGDLDRGLQNLELERRRLERELSEVTSKLDAREDMANVGEAFMEQIKRADPSYSWNNCPSEWVFDQINNADERVVAAERELEALRGKLALCRLLITDCQNDLATWIVPDSGISDHEVLNTLLGRLDGSQSRAALTPPEK